MKFVWLDTKPQRYICANRSTYRDIWPRLASMRVPAAYSLTRWVARKGGAFHCALRLHPHRNRGCCLVAQRPIKSGAALISVPVSLSISAFTQGSDDERNIAARWGPLEELAGTLTRELHNPSSFHRLYLEFLHDVYNSDATDQFAVNEPLQNELDAMYMGNALHVKGVPNAPFISKSKLVTASQRADWIRIDYLRRRMEQSLPHFASKSTSWGLSMALARALRDDDGGLTMYPLIDFSLHDYEPNAMIHLTHPECHSEGSIGGRWYDKTQPCAHLVARQTIPAGSAVTIAYSTRAAASQEDAEYWKMKWGFVPDREGRARTVETGGERRVPTGI
ncbi:hypothetical protein, conserved [Trypanosoma brucei gambiense DAL972]|uniref:SET domain-containing protein n=2 Tax=Trypanosoma brucei TaxID=5691 RepID=C9ZLX9_TRYB9|nr:hypothetical protein, conserved [Trypanosoma brucei gambiense DAL972]RHW72752.1 hypothetical protein DPX39_040015300 [Trypanosoma brucei equiperdum]CBH10404.1 hypothetical protein, conserved [Trypanosoma brucei gambiense DAL972]|eukprot:XP_011772694.1 hypothetical protein, conserved [Trypanosoma brucei gambiense DAL972]